ncbi:MAG: SDR family NAD(P)-dependent oxidoreductase [Acidimicrobiales bacterium]
MPMGPAQWDGVAGKQVVLTGGTSGIGLAAAEALAAKGANVAIVARDSRRGEEAAGRARAAAATAGRHPTVEVLLADLSSQAEVRRLAGEVERRYPRVEVLVNNAGAIFSRRQLTGDGAERTWAVNHLAPFLLTVLLLDKLQGSAPARVVTTGSEAGRRCQIPFDDLDGTQAYASSWSPAPGFRRYGETKLANIVFTMELARRTQGTGLSAYCFHPGNVATNFNRNNGAFMRFGMTVAKRFSRTPAEGAQTLVWLAESGALDGKSGAYFCDMKEQDVPAGANDLEVGRRLWEISETQVRVAASQAP